MDGYWNKLIWFSQICVTMIKIFIVSKKPLIIHYRKLTDFKNDAFVKNLKALLSKSFLEEIVSFVALRKLVNVTLEKHPSNKRRYNRGN